MDHSHLFSEVVKKRKLSYLLSFKMKASTGSPNMMIFSVGSPNPNTFPFREMTVNMKDGRQITIDPDLMDECLQYGSGFGYQPLIQQLKTLIKEIHNPPRWNDSELIPIPGNQMGLALIFEMLLNPGDVLIVSEPCYPGIFNALQGIEAELMGVQCDTDGAKPEDLERVLQHCKSQSKLPKILCMTPSGSNPEGTVWSESRRRLIYDLACQYDLIILEDDSYYFLQFGEKFPPSFLQLDTEGRVMRLDSFSKTIGAGLRLGFATGPKDLMGKLAIQLKSTVDQPSLISEVLVSKMLLSLGLDGFLQNTKKIQQFYKDKRDVMIKAAEKHLKGLCEWNVPAAGFFLWLKVPGISDTKKLLFGRAINEGLLLIPGCGFFINSDIPCQYMRVSFSSAESQVVDEGFKVLAKVIREEIKEGNTND